MLQTKFVKKQASIDVQFFLFLEAVDKADEKDAKTKKAEDTPAAK